MDRRGLAENGVGVVVFLLVYAALLRTIHVGSLYAFGDLPPYYGARAFQKFLTTWHFAGLGYSYQYNVIPAYLGAITSVAGVLGQNLFYLALVPAGYLAFFVFVGRYVDSAIPRQLAAGLYAVNPLTIGEFSNGDVVSLIGFVGLPLVLHYLNDVVESDTWSSSLSAAMVFGATTVVPWLGFWMVAPFAPGLLYRARRTPRTLVKLAAAGVVGSTLALPGVYNVVQRAIGLQTSVGRELLMESLRWNYASATPLALLRLAGNHGDRTMIALGYNSDPVLAVAGLIVPGIALLSLPKRRVRSYLYVVVGVVAFAYATHLGITAPLFDWLPPLLSLRNPSKIMYALLVSLCVLFGVGVESVVASGNSDTTTGTSKLGRRVPSHSFAGIPDGRRRSILLVRRLRNTARESIGASRAWVRHGLDHRSVVVVCLVCLVLVTYVIPAQGALGIDATRGHGYYIHDEQQVTDRLHGRVLWAPYTYTTQLRLRHDYPNHVGIKSGGVYQGIQSDGYVTDLFRTFAQDPTRSEAVLSNLGVTYVVVDSSPPGPDAAMGQGPPRVVEKWGAPWLAGDPARFDRLLADSPAFAEAFRTDHFTVYRVVGVAERPRYEQYDGLNAVSYPTATNVTPLGANLLANPVFANGTKHWWTPPEMKTQVVSSGDGNTLLLEPTDPTTARAIAQEVPVRDRYPYRVTVDATGPASVDLFWYDGEKSRDNLVAHDHYRLGALPDVVRARGTLLSLRIRPNATRVRVDRASVVRTTYPARTGFAENVAGIPGVVVDANASPPRAATEVAVNDGPGVDDGAPVHLVDAETALDGDLVFGPEYRQGVAVRIPNGTLPAAVPADARAVTMNTSSGPVLDYWVTGSYDGTPVTVLRTSYDDGWRGPAGSTHFVAFGWANGFTNATPAEVRWTGGEGSRRSMLAAWLVSWVIALALLLYAHARNFVRLVRLGVERRRRKSTIGRRHRSVGRDD